MRNLLFTLLISIFSLGNAHAQAIELTFPDIAFDGTKAAVYFDVLPTENTTSFIQLRNGNHFDTLAIVEVDGAYMIEPTFFSDEGIVFDQVETIGKPTSVIPLWTSILPPLIAIFLALIFKEVVFSLISGIFIGSAIIGFYADGFIGIFSGFFTVIDTYIIGALNDSGHLSVIVFSILIGGIVAIISRNGGMQGIVNRITKYANTVRNGQLATWCLGLAIFFDDYANTLVVGNTMRPVTDRLKISREKLAYIVDSTAAPVSAIAFVTTWIGAELGYIASGVEGINANGEVISEGVYSIFLNSLVYSFYPILTLFFVFYLIIRQKDFGPMLKAERRARIGEVINPEVNNADLTEIEDLKPVSGIKYRAFNAVIPVGIIVFGTMLGLMFTGFDSLKNELLGGHPELNLNSWGDTWSNMSLLDGSPDSFTRKLGTLIGASDSYAALLWSSLSALVFAIFLTVGQRIMKLEETVNTAVSGFKTMISAILILILAWALASVTEDMHTAEFLTGLIGDSISPWLIPAITFILAAVVAFSTGSSWSTMALVYPIILPAAWAIATSDTYAYEYADAMALFYNTVSAVLAGAVLGDHCSPISDTTILSSLASGSNHIDHVRTQIPYALTVGLISVVMGTILSALGLHPLLGMLLGGIAIVLVIELFGKPSDNNALN
ncbi:Na+/H+ antiporter NhaC family protein [Crocinitomix catalasitica]|uniref:Na+/H+ antiporter NhaC family protein n=1 Tax=Crocinitomix catalasitica TaxID=184607 RepID=UPI000688A1AC|nr:Na+/H+ antiporter NhaC family protein [Crocinitomix catalasitica]